MATYKVLQDIEAEDKLIGPLSLRQCLYAAIAVVAGYCSFLAVSKGAEFLLIFFIPFIAFGVFFAFPWTKQQTTEVWALARIRFILKPRKRIWDQSGIKELVTITAPKKLKRDYASSLTPYEVTSRLQTLADTIDSRGWAIKNVNPAQYVQNRGIVRADASDRLVAPESMPREVPNFDTTMAVDIYDTANNPIAKQFDSMMAASSSARRQNIMQQMNNPQNQGSAAPGLTAAPLGIIPVAGDPTPAEQAFVEQLRTHVDQTPESFANLRTIKPISDDTPATHTTDNSVAPMTLPEPVQQPQQSTVTPPPNTAILDLANNNDLNVATIAREAEARNPQHPDEVIVSLHDR